MHFLSRLAHVRKCTDVSAAKLLLTHQSQNCFLLSKARFTSMRFADFQKCTTVHLALVPMAHIHIYAVCTSVFFLKSAGTFYMQYRPHRLQ